MQEMSFFHFFSFQRQLLPVKKVGVASFLSRVKISQQVVASVLMKGSLFKHFASPLKKYNVLRKTCTLSSFLKDTFKFSSVEVFSFMLLKVKRGKRLNLIIKFIKLKQFILCESLSFSNLNSYVTCGQWLPFGQCIPIIILIRLLG